MSKKNNTMQNSKNPDMKKQHNPVQSTNKRKKNQYQMNACPTNDMDENYMDEIYNEYE